MSERVLFVGPYAGEFGWELCLWNPYVRALAVQYDRVVVAAPETSRYLYEFAHQFLPVHVVPGTSDFLSGQCTFDLRQAPDRGVFWLRPEDLAALGQRELENFARPYPGRQADPSKSWRYLGPEQPENEFDVAVAFRPAKWFNGRLHEDKAYSYEMCLDVVERLCAEGLRVVNVGGSDNFRVPGVVEDLRGAPLARQCEAIAGSFVTVGPSSAPLHLSQLCKTPVVTWYNRPGVESRGRYAGWWNPFAVPHRFLGRRPTQIEVVSAAMEFCR